MFVNNNLSVIVYFFDGIDSIFYFLKENKFAIILIFLLLTLDIFRKIIIWLLKLFEILEFYMNNPSNTLNTEQQKMINNLLEKSLKLFLDFIVFFVSIISNLSFFFISFFSNAWYIDIFLSRFAYYFCWYSLNIFYYIIDKGIIYFFGPRGLPGLLFKLIKFFFPIFANSGILFEYVTFTVFFVLIIIIIIIL